MPEIKTPHDLDIDALQFMRSELRRLTALVADLSIQSRDILQGLDDVRAVFRFEDLPHAVGCIPFTLVYSEIARLDSFAARKLEALTHTPPRVAGATGTAARAVVPEAVVA